MSTLQKIVVDVDGTIADCSHRVPLIPDWDAFHAACPDDKPYERIVQLVSLLRESFDIVLLTGRSEEFRPQTIEWLWDNHVDYDTLIMRPTLDHSPDVDLKWKLLVDHCGSDEEVQHKVFAVIEDRDRVVEMWRNKGLTCLQPRLGDY